MEAIIKKIDDTYNQIMNIIKDEGKIFGFQIGIFYLPQVYEESVPDNLYVLDKDYQLGQDEHLFMGFRDEYVKYCIVNSQESSSIKFFYRKKDKNGNWSTYIKDGPFLLLIFKELLLLGNTIYNVLGKSEYDMNNVLNGIYNQIIKIKNPKPPIAKLNDFVRNNLTNTQSELVLKNIKLNIYYN